ncbi:Putative uncharacterized protein [Moritella viscosa]|uniref:Uncharacterized protein n=1 Tax=Moritella viscosa TaxID=80854 RepID=A0ABY1HB10_9GAMM|nr:Putative uncharacterized protein [Moritella viscosa]
MTEHMVAISAWSLYTSMLNLPFIVVNLIARIIIAWEF